MKEYCEVINAEEFMKKKGRKMDSTIDEGYPDLIYTKNGPKPMDTYANLKYLLDSQGVTLRWNQMKHEREIHIPGYDVFRDDAQNSILREVENRAVLGHLSRKNVDAHLDSLAQQNRYHPIVECIKNNPWDGVARLDEFISKVKSLDQKLSNMLIRKWLISAIAAAFSEDGIALQGVLVLQGPQYIGKTEWIKRLDPIGCKAVLAGSILDPTSKDNIMTVSRHWIVELGELDGTFNKSDIARLKSFITNDSDEIRFPYGKKNTHIPRRTAFAASVNESNYLIDLTGNRRFWTIPVEYIDYNHGMDIQQIWAEVYQLFLNGESYKLTVQEMSFLQDLNSQHEVIDPLEEKVLKLFHWEKDWRNFNTIEMTNSEILHLCGYEKSSIGECMRMSKIIFKLTGKEAIKRERTRVHILPRRSV